MLPLLLGIYIIWYFYNALGPQDKEQMGYAFSNANYTWIGLSLLLGWFSHLSRSYRWRYLLEPIGAKARFWTAYHSVMTGYIINLALPRAGEPARAGYLAKKEGVPFEKVFGTIFAERVIDLIMLAIIGSIAIGLQYDKLDEFMAIANDFNQSGEEGSGWLKWVIYGVIGAGILGFLFLYLTNLGFKTKVKKLALGFIEGLKSIFTMPRKWAFLAHTLFIWLMYIGMFSICYWSLAETADVPMKGILAGFVAGTIGIVVIQGGIGIYPILVGISVTLYLGIPENSDSHIAIHPVGTALGWIIWVSQTLLIILLGALSLLILSKIKPKTVEPITEHSK